jgi:hypothetical protein
MVCAIAKAKSDNMMDELLMPLVTLLCQLWAWRNRGIEEIVDGNRQSFVIVRNWW